MDMDELPKMTLTPVVLPVPRAEADDVPERLAPPDTEPLERYEAL